MSNYPEGLTTEDFDHIYGVEYGDEDYDLAYDEYYADKHDGDLE